MEFEFTTDGEKRRVKTDARSPRTEVTIDGTSYEVDWVRVRDGVISLVVGGRSHTVQVARRDGGVDVQLEGHQFSFDTGSRDDDSAVAAGASAGAGGTIKAPMPGNVVKVMIAEGDEVSVGTSLVVVEAMKMENELRAPRPGTVQATHVGPGDRVDKGQVLVTIA